MAGSRIPGPVGMTTSREIAFGGRGAPGPLGVKVDPSVIQSASQGIPGPLGAPHTHHGGDTLRPQGTHTEAPVVHSYCISGTFGALGGMFNTIATERLTGTWHDYTAKATAFRRDEAALGSSPHASDEFRQLSQAISTNLQHPAPVDVDVHFQMIGDTEVIKVRGRKGVRTFQFRLADAERAGAAMPKGADPLKPLYDLVERILDAMLEVR